MAEKQMDVMDLIPGKLKIDSRSLVDTEYMNRKNEEQLPPIRTRYEAYGKMTESLLALTGAFDGVKVGMKDCMKSLSATDATFASSAEATYSSLLDVVMTAAEMAVQALNCVYKLEDMVADSITPLEEMAAGGNYEEQPSDVEDDTDGDPFPEEDDDEVEEPVIAEDESSEEVF